MGAGAAPAGLGRLTPGSFFSVSTNIGTSGATPFGRWLLSVAACLIPRGLRRRGKTRRRDAGARRDAVELGRAIGEMPEDMRRCFILHYHSGFGPAEIAELMRLPLQAVRDHLEEAHRRLSHWLEETGP